MAHRLLVLLILLVTACEENNLPGPAATGDTASLDTMGSGARDRSVTALQTATHRIHTANGEGQPASSV